MGSIKHPAPRNLALFHSFEGVMNDSFKRFQGWVAKKRMATPFPYEAEWVYREYGPKDMPALVCLPPLSGTADAFYKQMLSLCLKGYRIVSVTYPQYFSLADFVTGFSQFLTSIGVEDVHLMGATLGAFLALAFAESKPQRVASLVLCGGFHSTEFFSQNMPCPPGLLRYMPEFYLKRLVLANYPKDNIRDPAIVESIDFMVQQLEALDQEHVASRLTLNCTNAKVDLRKLKVPPSKVTLIETMDEHVLPSALSDHLRDALQGCKVAHIRKGGNFPFLAAHEDFTLHLEVHLRTIGGLRATALETAKPAEGAKKEATIEQPRGSVAG